MLKIKSELVLILIKKVQKINQKNVPRRVKKVLGIFP